MKRLTAFAILTGLAVQPAAAWTHGGFSDGTSLAEAQAALAGQGRSLEQVTTSNDQDSKTYVVQPAGAPILNFCHGVLAGYIDPIDGGIQGFLRRVQALSLQRPPSQMPIFVLPRSPGGLEIIEASWENPDGSLLTLSWSATPPGVGAGLESVSRRCSAAVADASRGTPAGATVPAPDTAAPAAVASAPPQAAPAREAAATPEAPAASPAAPPAQQNAAAEPTAGAAEPSSASAEIPATEAPQHSAAVPARPDATAQAEPPSAASAPLPPEASAVSGRQDSRAAVASSPAAQASGVAMPLPAETGLAAIEPPAPVPLATTGPRLDATASDATPPAVSVPLPPEAPVVIGRQDIRGPVAAKPPAPAPDVVVPLPPEPGLAVIEPAAPDSPAAPAARQDAVASDATPPAILAPQARTAELESRSDTIEAPAARSVPLPPVRPAEFSRLPAHAEAPPAARAPRRAASEFRVRPVLPAEPPPAAGSGPPDVGASGAGGLSVGAPPDIEPPIEGASRGMAAFGLALPRSTGSVGPEPDRPALRPAGNRQPPNCTRYRSFNPATRTYTALDGTVRPCR